MRRFTACARRLRDALRRLLTSCEVERLHIANQDLQQDVLILQDRLDAALADRSKLWDLVEQALAGERTAYQMHINVQWQRQSGSIPYPDAPHLPPHAVPKPPSTEPIGRRGRMLASEMLAQAKREFVERELTRKDEVRQ